MFRSHQPVKHIKKSLTKQGLKLVDLIVRTLQLNKVRNLFH